jgi:hypothetical protein
VNAGKEHIIAQTKLNTDYTTGNNALDPFYHEGGLTATGGTFTRRIGNTVYRVNVHSSVTSKETMSEKIIRLVINEVINPSKNG